MSTALDPVLGRPYHHFTQMTKFVAFLFITSGLLACHRSADNRPSGTVLNKQQLSRLNFTSRVLCMDTANDLLTYALSADSRYPGLESLGFDQKVLDYRMISSNGAGAEFLAAVVSLTDPTRAQIILVDYDLRKRVFRKLFVGVSLVTAPSFFATSPGSDFALLTEESGYALYDLKNRLRVRTYALNPSQFSNPRLSSDGEYALFAHHFGKDIFRQVLLSLSSGRGTPLPLVHSRSEPTDAQFITNSLIAWRESLNPKQLALLPASEIQAARNTPPALIEDVDGGSFTSYAIEDKTYIAIAGKTTLRLLELNTEALSVSDEKNYAYPFPIRSNETPTIESAPWSNDILVGFNISGKSLSFHTADETWSFQNCFFPRLGPETIVEIHE